MKQKLTSLSAASVVRHSLNGGDGLHTATVCRNSDCSFSHDGFIHLKSGVIRVSRKNDGVFLLFFYVGLHFKCKGYPLGRTSTGATLLHGQRGRIGVFSGGTLRMKKNTK